MLLAVAADERRVISHHVISVGGCRSLSPKAVQRSRLLTRKGASAARRKCLRELLVIASRSRLLAGSKPASRGTCSYTWISSAAKVATYSP